eukprot:g6605.t1
MLSDNGAKDAQRARTSPTTCLFRRGGGGGWGGDTAHSARSSRAGGDGASGSLGGLGSDGGSSGPPRSGGLGRGGGDGDGDRGRGDDGGDDRTGVAGDMVGFGAAQVMMLASDERSSLPEATLRGGYRRRSMYGRRPVQRSRRGTSNRLTATNVLIAFNAIVYAFQTRYPAITQAGWKLAPAITQRGQWYRLLTPVVLHGSFTHLAVNSMSFSSVGPVVERVMGKNKFVAVYALSGIAGNVLSCIVNPRTPAVGASGAIFGMVGAWGAFCLMNESVMGRDNSQRALRNIAQTVMINVVYGMNSSQIDNMGHLGGFLGGAAATFLIGPRLRRRQNPLTGEPYLVDESFKLALPWLGRKAHGSSRY